jgi:hypothetical protein
MASRDDNSCLSYLLLYTKRVETLLEGDGYWVEPALWGAKSWITGGYNVIYNSSPLFSRLELRDGGGVTISWQPCLFPNLSRNNSCLKYFCNKRQLWQFCNILHCTRTLILLNNITSKLLISAYELATASHYDLLIENCSLLRHSCFFYSLFVSAVQCNPLTIFMEGIINSKSLKHSRNFLHFVEEERALPLH